MHEGFLKGLQQPEYVHVLLNPLPVYGLAMGLVTLIVGLGLRSQAARCSALTIILIASASAWPVSKYGQEAYDRVKATSDSEGEKWLDEHMRRAEELVYVFYVMAALALVSIGAEWKRSRLARPLVIATLVLAVAGLGIGGYIAYAGGHIRHKEFRFEPAPEPNSEQHPGHAHERESANQQIEAD
jgi:hypothetical protein